MMMTLPVLLQVLACSTRLLQHRKGSLARR